MPLLWFQLVQTMFPPSFCVCCGLGRIILSYFWAYHEVLDREALVKIQNGLGLNNYENDFTRPRHYEEHLVVPDCTETRPKRDNSAIRETRDGQKCSRWTNDQFREAKGYIINHVLEVYKALGL